VPPDSLQVEQVGVGMFSFVIFLIQATKKKGLLSKEKDLYVNWLPW